MSRATYQVSLPHTSQAALFYLRLSSTTGTISQWTSVIDMVPIRQQSAIESLMREDWKSPAGPNALSLRSTYEQGNSNTGYYISKTSKISTKRPQKDPQPSFANLKILQTIHTHITPYYHFHSRPFPSFFTLQPSTSILSLCTRSTAHHSLIY